MAGNEKVLRNASTAFLNTAPVVREIMREKHRGDLSQRLSKAAVQREQQTALRYVAILLYNVSVLAEPSVTSSASFYKIK